MNRREFFKLTGLGAAALLVAPAVAGSAWTDQWAAEDAVKFAVAHALAHGATYADACIGPSKIVGHKDKFRPSSLLQADLLGMRVCTPAGWRKLVMRDLNREAIVQNLAEALDPHARLQPQRDHWIVAHFDRDHVLAHHSSDVQVAADLNMAMLRYGHQLALPQNGADTLYCDILLHQ